MIRRQSLNCFLIVSLLASPLLADSALDVIPENAVAAVAINNLGELKVKSTNLYKKADLGKFYLGGKPSEAFDWVYDALGIRGTVDEKGAAALVLAGCMPEKTSGWEVLNYLVGVIPFKDQDAIAARFGFKKGETKRDTIALAPAKRVAQFHCYFRGDHLIIGINKDAVLEVARAKPISGRPKETRRGIAGADIVAHVNVRRKEIFREWTDVTRDVRAIVAKRVASAADRKEVAELLDAVDEVGSATFAIHVDDGIRVGLLATLGKDAKESSRRAFTKLRGGGGSSDLSGLPVGRILTATSVRSDGSLNGRITHLLAGALAKEFANPFAYHDGISVLSTNEQSYLLGVFSQVWHRLDGVKVGVYQNQDPAKHGMFSVVAILDTKDPDEFLTEMKELARFSDPKGFDLSDGKPQPDLQSQIKKLIVQLGDEGFRSREAATLKLQLIGLAARSAVESASESKDPEIRYRARAIKAHFDRMEKESRAELLAENPINRVKPTFAFFPRHEQRGERSIDVIGCKLSEKDTPFAMPLRKYFGNDWKMTRIARHEKQLVVLFGSNVNLLDEAIENVVHRKPGIAKSTLLAGFARRSIPTRKVELHIAIKDLLPVAATGNTKKAPRVSTDDGPSSLSLAIEENQIRFDFWIPISELKAIAATKGARSLF